MKLQQWLFCSQCSDTKLVSAVENGQVILECSHVRKYQAPLKPGRVSVEHMAKKVGKEMFPVDRKAEITSSLPGVDFKWR